MLKTVYSLRTPDKVIAGPGSIQNLKDIIKTLNAKNVVIMTDPGIFKIGLADKVKNVFEGLGLNIGVINTIPPEPTVSQVYDIFEQAKGLKADLLVAVGGGSSMDMTKLVSVMFTNAKFASAILDNSLIVNPGIPMVFIPTTAGTGAEATPNAIVAVPEKETKVGIVSERMIANFVILDPEMTTGLPPSITSSTGLDAFSHALECYISTKANPFSDMFALEAMRLIFNNIRTATQNGSDVDARHAMLLAAYYGGTCIATAGTNGVHMLAYPLGGKLHFPHGISIAVLIPYVMDYNMDSCIEKFAHVADFIGLNTTGLSDTQKAKLFVDELYKLNRDLNISANLAQYNLTDEDLSKMADSALEITRLAVNNPKPITKEAVISIYKKLM